MATTKKTPKTKSKEVKAPKATKEAQVTVSAPSEVKKTTKKEQQFYYQAVGRRKEAVARVRLYIVSTKNPVQIGDKKYTQASSIINDRALEAYFGTRPHSLRASRPLSATGSEDRFVIVAQIRGGGTASQRQAYELALARALTGVETTHRSTLRAANMLTRDSRIRESRKVGTGGKARRAKQSPKR